jgi:hypothetical protein
MDMDKKDPVHAWPPRPPQPTPRAGSWRRARVAALLVAIAVLTCLTDIRRFLGSRLRGIEDGPTPGNGTVYDPMDPWDLVRHPLPRIATHSLSKGVAGGYASLQSTHMTQLSFDPRSLPAPS